MLALIQCKEPPGASSWIYLVGTFPQSFQQYGCYEIAVTLSNIEKITFAKETVLYVCRCLFSNISLEDIV